jgi:beta-1,4-mannosyl-glycoprotein beta-1,4-N-acetylglucosaminyltransferase
MLIDAFMFSDELDLLELRLEMLDEYVDRFVLVEAEVNHVGGPKELFFQTNRDRFSKWLHKIEHVIVTAEEAPKDENPWVREKYQRHAILKGLEGVPPEALIMISDVDEIPDMSKVRYEQLPAIVCAVHMWMFEYSFRYLFTGEPWIGTVITNVELMKRSGPNYFRDNRWKFPVFQYAGWHLSSFGTPMRIWRKFQTYAHAKDGHHASQTPETFEQFIASGKHTDGQTDLVACPPEVPLPGSPEVRKRLGLV